MINLAESKMMSFIYVAAWCMFTTAIVFDLTTVSSFDITELCAQHNLRTQNLTISSVQMHPETHLNKYTHHLRHAVRY